MKNFDLVIITPSIRAYIEFIFFFFFYYYYYYYLLLSSSLHI